MTIGNLKFFPIILLIGIAITGTGLAYAVSVTLDDTINLGEGDGLFPSPQLDTSGDNTVLIWRDGNQVLFSSSTSTTSNFSLQQIGDTGSSNSSGKPQVKISGNNVHAIWSESSGLGADIVFRNSLDAGTSFSAEIQVSDVNALSSLSPQISVDGTNKVLAVWHDKISSSSGNIVFKNGGINAADFGAVSTVQVGTADTSNPRPLVTSLGNTVYVVWQTDSDIKLATSTNGGASFDNTISVGSTGTASDSLPKFSSNGNNLFVIWKDGIDVKLAKISNDGMTIIRTDTVGDTSDFTCGSENSAYLATSGNDVYAVWCDDDVGGGDVMFYSSADNGDNFTVTNLSENTGLSTKPKIDVSSSNVVVAWSDATPTGSNQDILIATSSDKGASFDTANLSQNSGFSTNPQAKVSASGVMAVWQDDPTLSGINWDILFRAGGFAGSSVSFDKNQYRETGSAKITLVGGAGDDPIPATITSDSDPSGISIELEPVLESPGAFEGLVSFDPSFSSGGVLLAHEGDEITATAGSATGTASIFPRTVDILSKISGSKITAPIDLGLDASLKVTDQNSNLVPGSAELITVNVKTNGNPSGVTLTLTETGPDTGVFGGHEGDTATTLVFSTAPNPVVFHPFDVNISQTDDRPSSNPNASNKNHDKIDKILVDVTSESDSGGIQVDLTETGINSGIFVGTFASTQGQSVNATNHLLVSQGDFIEIINPTGPASYSQRLLATPHPAEKNIITTIRNSTSDDTATVSYVGTSAQIQVCDCIGQGGGGGGLVRPSLVVNALAGLGGGGSSSAPALSLANLISSNQVTIPPEVEQMILNHDSSVPGTPMDLGLFDGFGYPLTINENGFVLSGFSTTLETQALQTDTSHTLKFLFYESDKIQHFSLYTNLMGANSEIHQSDTQILYNDGQEIIVKDPNGFFEDVSLDVNELGDLKKEVILDVTFAKQMDTSDVIVRSWDPNFSSVDTYILDAIEVVAENSGGVPGPTYETPVFVELESTGIPIWIKNNAAWWSQEQIGDGDFVSGIEYLIKNKIIHVPGVEVGTSSSSDEIPDWIKNNAGWWADSLITDGDFIEAMQWLVANGVIQI